jgi:hypothetical protein
VFGLFPEAADWFARRDVVPVEPSERPAQYRGAGQLAAVITDNHLGHAALDQQALQFAYDPHAAEVVDYTEDAKAAPIAECIRNEIERPALLLSAIFWQR